MIHDAARLTQFLGNAHLQPVMSRLRRRLRHGNDLWATIAISKLSADERSAIDRMLMRRPSLGTSTTIRPLELERILQDAKICDGLEEALAHLFGKVPNERAAREVTRQRWADVRAAAVGEFVDLLAYHAWLQQAFSSGNIKRCSGRDPDVARKLLRHVADVLRGVHWPIIPIAELASRLTGDSHALDRGMPLARLSLSALASQRLLERSKFSARALWGWAGVMMDELSAPVLVLNLRADPQTLIGGLLNRMADSGEPCHLSARLLRLTGVAAFAQLHGQVVYACENPSVVAAATHRLGSGSKPLICTAGQPAPAVQLLLTLLRQVGCKVRYHGDFDPAGIAIANLLISRFSVEPWRMNAIEYSACMIDGPPFDSFLSTAHWDPTLISAMNESRHAVLEESVIDSLLNDLRES